MDTTSIVRRAVTVFAEHPRADLNQLRRALQSAGLMQEQASDVIEFVPLAFARTFLDGMGIVFEDEYVRVDDQGRERMRRKLMDEATYRDALAVAPEVMATAGQDAFLAVASRSSELQAVNTALHHGVDPAGLQASEPTMLWVGEKKAWWKVW
ncbi:MAG TPA: hypothetical protein VGQ76_20550 [Thermoanaerobaculia bacterium]|jgi:hypothetical protein|nr:hypothetical protein [Thermoanaerobaculia bacterium]